MRRIFVVLVATATVSLHAQSIATVVGGGSDDGQLATAIPITSPRGIAIDSKGVVHFVEGVGRVRRIDANGIVTTIAGNGAAGFNGDGGAAVNAVLNQPLGLAFDASDNLYIADAENGRIRRIDAKTGIITTTLADLKRPAGLAFAGGFLYVTEAGFDGNRVRRINLATNAVETIAGAADGTPGFSGDGAAAVNAKLDFPFGIAVDAAGNIFVAANERVRRIDAQTKVIDTYAGGGNPADGVGDNLVATSAKLAAPTGIGFDSAGNLLISCVDTGSLRKVDKTTKIITTFASGVYLPTFVTSDSRSVLWSSDDERIYRVAANGSLTTFAGGGTFIGDGRVATAAILQDPNGVTVAPNGDLLIADTGHNVLRRVAASTGRISTIAGQPGVVYVDDQEGADASKSIIGFPRDVKLDSTGAIYMPDLNNARIWRIDTSNKITTYVKDVEAWALAFDASNNLYFVGDNALYRIDAVTKAKTTVAGQVDSGFSGDGGQASQAKLSSPRGVAIDAEGNIFISDEGNSRVRKIDRTGIITTYAGGDNSFLGDDGLATAALVGPRRIAIDKRNGDLYIADGTFHRVRRVNAATKIITTVAGSATFYTDADFAGDGGKATLAKLNFGFSEPSVALSSGGDVYIADVVNNRVRAVFACAAVATPLLTRPADNSTNVSTAPTLAWSDTLNAFRYDVLLDTVSPPVKVAASDVSENSFTPANLLPATKYFWRVVAKGDSFCASASSTSSAIASFTTSAACAASAFDTIAPADGAQVADPSVLLSWTASAGAASYDVFFSAFNPPSRVATGITATSFRVNALAGTYSWFVVAHASCDPSQTATTPQRTFTSTAGAQCPQQSVVTLTSPSNGLIDVSQSPDLIWSLNGFASSFDLYLGTSPDPPLYAANIVDSHQNVASLEPGTIDHKTYVRGIGTVHGLAGNVRALLQVDDPRNESLRVDSAAALVPTATHEDGLANWSSERKLQWCAGAPGVVSAARDYLDEELLLAGAELVWRAGPPGTEKGHGICHGTSGNGFALLAAFERTQDELWLARARRFAVHALGQAARLPGRYSLFTGGAGTALFAAACLEADARYPLLERRWD